MCFFVSDITFRRSKNKNTPIFELRVVCGISCMVFCGKKGKFKAFFKINKGKQIKVKKEYLRKNIVFNKIDFVILL